MFLLQFPDQIFANSHLLLYFSDPGWQCTEQYSHELSEYSENRPTRSSDSSTPCNQGSWNNPILVRQWTQSRVWLFESHIQSGYCHNKAHRAVVMMKCVFVDSRSESEPYLNIKMSKNYTTAYTKSSEIHVQTYSNI